MSEMLQVTMLGGFSICWKGRSLDDSANRMRKIWLLLAYLIYTRNNSVTQENYLALLQHAGGAETEDPVGRLKASFYRVRTMLNQLGDKVGHHLIVRRNGQYAWNTEEPLRLDVEEFDQLCTAAAAEEDKQARLEKYLQALRLYRGDFLPKLSMESWAMPISVYYHQMYLKAVDQALQLLEEREQWEQTAAVTEQALKIEPYSEELYQHLMRSQIAMGDRIGAQTTYEEMSELLFDAFSVMPSEESRQIYRQAAREVNSATVSPSAVREQLREPAGAEGAMFCEYDFFKLLYQVQARMVARSGESVHVALLTLHGYGKKELARRSMDYAMDNLQELVIGNLRQGDVVSRCSASQLIVMLPRANYENSCMVCQRVIKAFTRKYPHSPANIHYGVQPLEPKDSRSPN